MPMKITFNLEDAPRTKIYHSDRDSKSNNRLVVNHRPYE